jgi:hypothetical protein
MPRKFKIKVSMNVETQDQGKSYASYSDLLGAETTIHGSFDLETLEESMNSQSQSVATQCFEQLKCWSWGVESNRCYAGKGRPSHGLPKAQSKAVL